MLKTAIPLEKATFQRELTYTIAKTKKKGKTLLAQSQNKTLTKTRVQRV